MNKTRLMLIPAGGLANRMRAVVSAYNLCRAVGGKMQVVWFRDWALNAPFRDIFRPVDSSLFDLREARGLDFLVNDRPRRRNFWIPKAFQKVVFDARIYEQFVTPLKQTDFDFEAWLRGRRCYMSCYQEFGTFDNALYKKIFRPVDEVMERVETFRESFSRRRHAAFLLGDIERRVYLRFEIYFVHIFTNPAARAFWSPRL